MEITWGEPWGGGWRERMLSLHSYVQRKGTTEYENRKSQCTDHDVNPTIPLSQPVHWQIIKTVLKANGFSRLRIVSDVRYTDSGKPLPVSRLGCYAAATASSSQSIGSLFTFAADPRRRLMARSVQIALAHLKETRSQNRL